ncbi:hypothetical protein NLG97_g4749 [Lecanicillium saksenae]|uniref:Uncharacterized protein n=1 Tax=Lecanicillium saksenae TaxID=468837 RepID=A0ACC1QVQ7_9HYPO|nr:hypothetical protein NLG97_g4749 [Lecanicillium saksenae]
MKYLVLLFATVGLVLSQPVDVKEARQLVNVHDVNAPITLECNAADALGNEPRVATTALQSLASMPGQFLDGRGFYICERRSYAPKLGRVQRGHGS